MFDEIMDIIEGIIEIIFVLIRAFIFSVIVGVTGVLACITSYIIILKILEVLEKIF